ncbi:WXG100 family type VII secretion target [Mycetocola spongiae]|uniref:WXG100 family type VII secretion target n=1 Tax=Mycetocola spongiae TaxID=2859226 RepID=UPI001CF2C1E4|nr:WXG100 family type VII secretion target [Mycetocola spongiae]UCR89974.1 WXG100 family type VII secretion target [Mycetocola spongiae]
MANIRVSSESLHQASSRLQSGAGEINGLLSQLRSVVDGLGSEWEGTGSAAFTSLYEQFNRAGLELNESLDGISVLLGRAGDYYTESEANVTRAFQG